MKLPRLHRGDVIWELADVTADVIERLGRATFDALDDRLFLTAYLIAIPSNSTQPLAVAGYSAPDPESLVDLASCIQKDVAALRAGNAGASLSKLISEEVRISLELIRAAVDAASEHATTLVGMPRTVNSFDVFPILRLDREGYESYPANDGGESLASSLAEQFLRQVTRSLGAAPAPVRLRVHPGELLRSAGTALMADLEPQVERDPLGFISPFEKCERISSQYYENAESEGWLSFCRATEEELLGLSVRFLSTIPLDETRTARKLIETTSDDFELRTDGQVLLGLAERKEGMPSDTAVRFAGHNVWELWQGDRVVMRVESGVPGRARRPLEGREFVDRLRQVDGLSDADGASLWDLVHEAMEVGHGTTLVVSADAAHEAERLGVQGIVIHPVQTTRELVASLSSIDGAILLDPAGRCHAFGIILDGAVSKDGSRARGSRFNSAVRYEESNRGRCAVIVLSDDGMVDVVPSVEKP